MVGSSLFDIFIYLLCWAAVVLFPNHEWKDTDWFVTFLKTFIR